MALNFQEALENLRATTQWMTPTDYANHAYLHAMAEQIEANRKAIEHLQQNKEDKLFGSSLPKLPTAES